METLLIEFKTKLKEYLNTRGELLRPLSTVGVIDLICRVVEIVSESRRSVSKPISSAEKQALALQATNLVLDELRKRAVIDEDLYKSMKSLSTAVEAGMIDDTIRIWNSTEPIREGCFAWLKICFASK